MSVKFQDYYEILGVPRSASAEEIRRAYRKLARQYHPDVNKAKDAEEKFKRINEAYEVLKDPETRQRYDSLGSNWKAGQEFRPPPGFESFTFHFGGPGGRSHRGDTAGFSDFFEALFGGSFGDAGGGGQRRAGRRGPSPFSGFENFGEFEAGPGAFSGDVESEVEIPMETAVAGGTVSVRLAMPGQGTRSYDVKIPKAMVEGRKIRLAGQGQQGGDLYLKIRYRPDPRFEVEGANVVTEAKVTPWEAALGAKVPVETMEGRVQVTIPAGSSSGKRLRMKGHGLPKGEGGRGDLLVRVMVHVPAKLSPRERELMEKLAKESGFNPRE